MKYTDNETTNQCAEDYAIDIIPIFPRVDVFRTSKESDSGCTNFFVNLNLENF